MRVELHTWSLAESTLYASPDVTEPPKAATTTGRTAHARRKQARRPSPGCGVTPCSSMLGRSQLRGGRDDVLGCPRLRAMTDCRLCGCPVQPMRKTRPVRPASQNKSANRSRLAEAGRGGPRRAEAGVRPELHLTLAGRVGGRAGRSLGGCCRHSVRQCSQARGSWKRERVPALGGGFAAA